MKYRLILILAFVICSFSIGWAQSKPCLLDIKNSPALRGIKLGMKRTDVEMVLRSRLLLKQGKTLLLLSDTSPFHTDQLKYLLNKNDTAARKTLELFTATDHFIPGIISLKVPNDELSGHFPANKYQQKIEEFKDISYMNFNFFDNKVSSFDFNYKTTAFDGVTDAEFFSEMFKLLNISKDVSAPASSLRCKDFQMRLHRQKDGFIISLEDLSMYEFNKNKAIQIVNEMYEKLKKEAVNKQ